MMVDIRRENRWGIIDHVYVIIVERGKREKAAILIQTRQRGKMGREYVDFIKYQNEMACKIQSIQVRDEMMVNGEMVK